MRLSSTPGPWMVEPINDGETYQITTSEDTGFVVIAETVTGHPIDHANAVKMAAAPELLEALKAALQWIDRVPASVKLPAMPGFDRGWVDGVVAKAEVL